MGGDIEIEENYACIFFCSYKQGETMVINNGSMCMPITIKHKIIMQNPAKFYSNVLSNKPGCIKDTSQYFESYS